VEPSTQDHEAAASLLYIVGRVNQGIGRQMRTSLAPWKLSVSQYTTLSVLHSLPGLSNAQLARRALVAPQSMLEIVAQLEQRGLVQRAVDPEHALILRAELTRKGRGVLRDASPAIRAIENELLGDVSRADRATVLRVMSGAMNRLSQPATRRPRR
jgi:DNA-binding MarR family transcriptional regulator